MLWLMTLLVLVLLMLQGTVVSVNTRIYPQKPVLGVGSDLNFTTKGLNDQVSGRWFSGNQSILSVSMSSGRAVAVGQGTTQVRFESSRLKLQTTVRVVIDDISVDAPKEMLTNVPFPRGGYNFSVKLRKSGGKYKGVPFDCRVEPRYAGYAVPWMDRADKNFYCLFFPYSPELLMRLAPGLQGTRPVTSVSIIASLTGANQVSGRASARFIGGFSILGRNGHEAMKLNLNRDSNTTSITLVGNADVQIDMKGWGPIKVSPISREDFGIGSNVVYEVKVLRDVKVLVDESFSKKIIISLAANGQRVEIDVDYDDMYELPVVIQVFIVISMVVFCVGVCSLDHLSSLYRGWDWIRRRQIFPTSDDK